MEKEIKDKLNKIFKEENKLQSKTLLVIKSKHILSVSDEDDGMELNDGYDFEVNGAIPEVADAIAKMAIELENNNFGKGSGRAFVSLIIEYYNRLIEG